jgi:opacity protein-like surface antigen
MKFVIIAALLAVAAAAPAKLDDVKPVAILRSAQEVNDDGSYSFSYAAENGINVEESGSQRQIDPLDADSVGTIMRGSYSFVADDGKTYTVNWIADENGFQPSAAHLPVAPTA